MRHRRADNLRVALSLVTFFFMPNYKQNRSGEAPSEKSACALPCYEQEGSGDANVI